MIAINEIKSKLNLESHLLEGGYFVETYRSHESIPKDALPNGYEAARSLATAIYYLLTPDTFSRLHRLCSDEIFHFYLGDPVEMVQLLPDGSTKVLTLGSDILNGMRPQVVVAKGVWQGARLCPGGEVALLGTTMSPGFEFADYEVGDRSSLIQAYPQSQDLIIALTK